MSGHDDDLRQLDELLELPEGDPRRDAMLRDPAVRALYDSYAAFMQAESAGVPGLDRAQDALSRFRGEHIAGGAVEAREERPRAVRAKPGPSFWERLFSPGWRPALAFAALVIVAGAVFLTMQPRRPSNVVVLRGGRGGEMELLPARVTERGVELTWRSVSDADSYEVLFYTTKLEQLATLGETAETTATVPASMRTLMARGDIEVLYRVVARRQGDELSHSPVVTLP